MKRISFFLGCLFTVFLRLQIYKAIAAIFWQFASYVFLFFLFKSQCASSASTAAIFRQFAGNDCHFDYRHILPKILNGMFLGTISAICVILLITELSHAGKLLLQTISSLLSNSEPV